ncbi:MAG TPA: porin family protein [Thermoanaerobaculia bacterium]|nr:porin family protein [Thermoanaerobaculia bacterium]
MALALGLGSAPAWAQWHFGVSGGVYQAEQEAAESTEVLGIRGGYRINPSFRLEAALTRVDIAATFPEAELPPEPLEFESELYNLDVSLQWFPWHDLVVFGGAGFSRLEASISGIFLEEDFSDSDLSTVFTAHAGVGYEWTLGNHLFVRPEVRYRFFFDDDLIDSDDGFTLIFDASGYEAGLVLGWQM